MKNKLSKIISSLLILSFLISTVSVLALATDGGAEQSEVTTIFNRGFDDGWEETNGGSFGGKKYHTCEYGKEFVDGKINRYLDMTSSGEKQACYYQIFPPAADMEGVTDYVLEMDMRSDGITATGALSLLYTRLASSEGHSDFHIIRKDKEGNLRFTFGTDVKIADTLPSEWTHFAFLFHADSAAKTMTIKCYVDGEYIAEGSVTTDYNLYSTLVRFQLCSGGGVNAGDNLSFDNIKLYTGTSEITELAADDYGTLVDTSIEKTVPIGANEKVTVFNRGFDDGWEATNGANFAGYKDHACGYGEEPTSSGGINHFINMTSSGVASACYYQIFPTPSAMEYVTDYVIEFDIRSDGYTLDKNISLLYTRLELESGHTDLTLIRKDATGALVFAGSEMVTISDTLPDEWMHLAFIFNVDYATNALTVKCYADGEYIGQNVVTAEVKSYSSLVRFQLSSSGGCNAGDNICFDNIKLYSGSSEITELAPGDYGTLVDTSLEKTVEIKLNDPLFIENSKYLVMCIEYLMDYETEEEWEENYKLLSYVVGRIRAILKEGKYDPTYGELPTLFEGYNAVNDYFYEKLQEEHIAYLEKLMASFEASESYVEKLTLCHEIDKYVANAEIDADNATIAQLLAKNEENRESLDGMREDYIDEMHESAELFVAAIAKINSESGYTEIVESLDEAEDYYFTMIVADTDNVTKEEISSAIEKYYSYIEYANSIKAVSSDFIILASAIPDAKYSELYRMLIDMKGMLDYVSEDISGVAEAIEAYEEAYDAYVDAVTSANSDINEAQGAVVTMRANFGVAGILAIFAELIGFVFN